MTATELRRGAWINDRYLRFADVLRWAEQNPPEDVGFDGDQAARDARALVGYLLHRVAVDRVGRGAQVVNQRVNTWSQDGSRQDIEVTVGRPAPPSTGATWTDCTSYWLYWRADEVKPAAEALDLYRRFRKADRDLYAEHVEVDYAPPRGAGIETRRFWIVYPAHVVAYANDSDRISRAYGSGPTKTAALLAAIEPVSTGRN